MGLDRDLRNGTLNLGEAWKKRGYRTTCPDYGSGLVLPPVELKQNSLRIPIFECRGRSGLGSADMSALLESWSWFLQLLLSENWPFIATTFYLDPNRADALPRTVRPCWGSIVFS